MDEPGRFKASKADVRRLLDKDEKRRAGRRTWRTPVRATDVAAFLAAAGVSYVYFGGAATIPQLPVDTPAPLYAASEPTELPFVLCTSVIAGEADCVIDGDTIDYRGQRVRMVDYDTPEIAEPKCASEEALGHQAKLRLLEILNSGPVEVRRQGDRDADKNGRKLRLVTVGGRSVGDILIAEGLAVRWAGRRHKWC